MENTNCWSFASENLFHSCLIYDCSCSTVEVSVSYFVLHNVPMGGRSKTCMCLSALMVLSEMCKLPMTWALTYSHTSLEFWTLCCCVHPWFPKTWTLKCGLIWPQHTFPLCASPFQMSWGPEKSALFLDVVDIWVNYSWSHVEISFIQSCWFLLQYNSIQTETKYNKELNG